MGLEVGTWITDLNIANPLDADAESFGAAHFRLVKSVLQNTLLHGDRATDLSLLNNVAALCVLANPTNALAAAQALVAAVDGQILRRSGTALGFGSIDAQNPAVVRKPTITGYNTGTVVVTTSVAFVDLTGVLASLEAGSTYAIDVYVESNNTGAGGMAVKATFTNPTLENQGVADHYQSAMARLAGAFTAGYAFGTAGAGADYCYIHGRVRTNLASVMQIQVAQNAAAGSNTYQIGCWIKATKLN